MSDQRLVVVCLVVLAGVAAATGLYWLRPVMIPFVLALMLAYGLTPLVEVLARRLRLPRMVAVLAALVLGGLLFTGVGALVTGSVKKLAANGPAYEARVVYLATQLSAWLDGHGLGETAEAMREGASNLPVGRMLVTAANTAVALLSNGFLILIFLIYLLQGDRAPPPPDSFRARIGGRIRRYLVIKIAMSAITGFLVALLLWLLGVELALVFGVLAFVLNFIPSVGSIVAVFLPLPLVLVDPDVTWVTVALVLALPGAVQVTIGNIIEPKLMGDSLELHPVMVLLCLIFWGALWGIPGMILAAPLTAVLKIVLEQAPATRPIALAMAGRVGESAQPTRSPTAPPPPAAPVSAPVAETAPSAPGDA